MTLNRSLLVTLDTDFNTAVRGGDKDKAIAVFSALVGIAMSVASVQTGPLYAMLSNVTGRSIVQLSNDKAAVVNLIARNNI